MIHDRLIETFYHQAGRKEKVELLEEQIVEGKLTISSAVDQLFEE